MMAQARLALMCKVRVGMGRRTQGFLDLIALAGNGVGSKTANGTAEKLGMPGWLGRGKVAPATTTTNRRQDGIARRRAVLFLIAATTAASGAVHAEEVAQAVTNLAAGRGASILGGHDDVDGAWVDGDGDVDAAANVSMSMLISSGGMRE